MFYCLKNLSLALTLILFVTNRFDWTNAEMFTSTEQMTLLVNTHAQVTRYLKEFLASQYKQLDEAIATLNEFESLEEESKLNPENFIGNPVNSFLLIKKLTKDLQKFVDQVNSLEKLKDVVREIKEKFLLPTSEDYEGAVIALMRLEDTYALEPNEIRNGNLSLKYPSKPLNAFECYEFGRIAYEQEDYYHTIRWMNEALDQCDFEKKTELQPTANELDILDYLAFANGKQGNLNIAIELTKRILKLNPNHERSLANLEFYKRNLKETLDKLLGDTNTEVNSDSFNPFAFRNERPPSVLGPEREIYEELCRGDLTNETNILKGISLKRLSKLKCRYLTNGNPFLLIGPIKQEEIHDSPGIWVFHDVISDSKVDLMKSLALPKLKRAIIRNPITGQYEPADYRISKSAWLNDNEVTELSYLTHLVSAVTNLSMSTAEEWQIANYGIGGQYDPHFDFARKSDPGRAFDESIGNRIATWLFYLEVPEKGGATVFPTLGARIQPSRRSAAFWFNLLPNGEGDMRTRHAACPVLFGSKWVSNKWLHERGQEFRRPCDAHNNLN